MRITRFHVAFFILAAPLSGQPGTLADPAVDDYNFRVGSQTFGGLYQFTTNTMLVETAEALREMGSTILKMYVGPDYQGKYNIALPPAISNLVALASKEPSCRRVLDLPFKFFPLWCYSFTGGWWTDGFSEAERQREYQELETLTRYLLTNYTGSGKTFYIGHWEGDWHLLEGYDPAKNPTPAAIQGMRDWMNTRQAAVDNIRASTPHSGVEVYAYTEVNRVLDAIYNGTGSNQRVINYVVPFITNLDFVSWSSYDGQNLSSTAVSNTLDYIAAQMTTNKAVAINGRRVFVGEYGWGGLLPDAQEPPVRAYVKTLLGWGCPFILFWQMYNNEAGKYWCLIDSQTNTTACHHFHSRLLNHAKLAVAEFKQQSQRLPDSQEYEALVRPKLSAPLPAPVGLTVSNRPPNWIKPDAANLSGSLRQGIYGDEQARMYLCWGVTNGGDATGNWQHVFLIGTNTFFGTSAFSQTIAPLMEKQTYYYRFLAVNSGGYAWAETATNFATPGVGAIFQVK